MDNLPTRLPEVFTEWFRARGWTPRPHQLAVLDRAQAGSDVLLISPTGGGKTLAGFLPSLVELTNRSERQGIHTLYVSPLKALAVDIARNLETPVREMGLPIRIETRTGDTPHSRRKRQREKPPDISDHDARAGLAPGRRSGRRAYAEGLERPSCSMSCIRSSHRNAVCSCRLLCRGCRAWHPRRAVSGFQPPSPIPTRLRAWLAPQGRENKLADLVLGAAGAAPQIRILKSAERVPWAGHSSRYAIPEVYAAIKAARMTLDLRQYPLAGGNDVPWPVDGE